MGASEFVCPHLLPANETHSIRTIIYRSLICAGFRSGISMTDVKQERLQSASNPRRATLDDVILLSRLFASAFMDDPVFDYMVRSGEKRRTALETFFKAMFTARDIPQNEVWMSSDGNACVSWLPSGARRGASGLRVLKWLPWAYRVFGFERFGRAMAIQEAMEKNHPKEPHFYLAFIAVLRSFGVPVSDHAFSKQRSKRSMLPECLLTLKTAERETRFSINAPGLSRKVTSHQKAHRRFWRCGANLISPSGSLSPQLAQSVDWLSAGLRLQLGVHRKWSSDCQTGALDPVQTLRLFRTHGRQSANKMISIEPFRLVVLNDCLQVFQRIWQSSVIFQGLCICRQSIDRAPAARLPHA